jgi:2-iminobutanoate/2-iminopropanoate deaminase
MISRKDANTAKKKQTGESDEATKSNSENNLRWMPLFRRSDARVQIKASGDLTNMNIERIISPHVAEPPPGRWSNALRVDDMLFISGMVSRAPDGVAIQGSNEYEQAKIIFGKIRYLVEAAGGAMSDIVKVTIYVVNIRHNTEVWRARQEFFTGDFPCSTLVEVRSLATPEILVEIDAIACLGAGQR